MPVCLKEYRDLKPGLNDIMTAILGSSEKGISMPVTTFSYISRAILKKLLHCDRKGAEMKLEMKKFILELVCEYLADTQALEEDSKRPASHHRQLLLQIRNHILGEPNVHLHTQKKLARTFGISESLLKREFKVFFETTLSQYVRLHALTKAHYLLATTRRTVDDVADEIGYSARSAFEEAFKKYYRYSPAALRSGRNP